MKSCLPKLSLFKEIGHFDSLYTMKDNKG